MVMNGPCQPCNVSSCVACQSVEGAEGLCCKVQCALKMSVQLKLVFHLGCCPPLSICCSWIVRLRVMQGLNQAASLEYDALNRAMTHASRLT